MKKILQLPSILPQSFLLGLALFSMFFGAGNIIFPLAVGQFAGESYLDATFGLVITAVVLPLLGVITMILYDGNYRAFFGKIGRIPGLAVAAITISLLGPLGSTPRCIALSYSLLKEYFRALSPEWFSLIVCLFIFVVAVQKKHLIKLLGAILTPLLLLSLFVIIMVGVYLDPPAPNGGSDSNSLFFYGLKEGYNTMDLLAAFFFSSSIVQLLKKESREFPQSNNYLKIASIASVIASLLLATVYMGFSFLTAKFGMGIQGVGKDLLLSRLSSLLMGEYGGIFVCLITSLACLTTAIALISSFADFIHKELFLEKMNYELVLGGSLFITYVVSIFEFSGISQFLGPVLEICYPGLICLTLYNFLQKLYSGLKLH